MPDDMREYIHQRKKELGALIMAHYYQPPEIQEVADLVGDSLQLAREAAATDARVVVTCGVSFMAESAKILSPEKIILLPEPQAGCPMADMVTAAALREKKQQHPGAAVVCYVNSSAEVKAESDICCTSANALEVVKSIPREREILFVPDRNLGAYIARQTGREMILWEGCCPIHDVLTVAEVQKEKELHPQALLVVHPECPPQVTEMADAVRSTGGILKYAGSRPETEFIIGTEEGFLYPLQKKYPDKQFFLARSDFQCRDMKTITMEKLAASLRRLEYQVEVPGEILRGARAALERMLVIG